MAIFADERELHLAGFFGMLNGPTAREGIGGFGDQRADQHSRDENVTE